MKIRDVRGTGAEKTTGWFISCYNQWPGLFKRTNWTDFTVIEITFENARYTGRYEVVLCLLGIWVEIQYVYDDTFNKEMNERLKDLF